MFVKQQHQQQLLLLLLLLIFISLTETNLIQNLPTKTSTIKTFTARLSNNNNRNPLLKKVRK